MPPDPLRRCPTRTGWMAQRLARRDPRAIAGCGRRGSPHCGRRRTRASPSRARPRRVVRGALASVASVARACASASSSPGGTSRPLTPSVTSSGMPDSRLATTGRPLAIASMRTTGMPSRLPPWVGTLGAASTSDAASSAATASLVIRPTRVTRSPRPYSSMRAWSASRSGPSPMNRHVNATPRSARRRQASIRWI